MEPLLIPAHVPEFVNQSAPSGPTAIEVGSEMLASVKLLKWPVVVTLPMEPQVLDDRFVNQSAPSGPEMIDVGSETLGSVKLLTRPVAGSTSPMELFPLLTNHSWPFGPLVMESGVEMLASLK
jgi:hypothetical protein